MIKALSKEIMKRAKLRNNFPKNRAEENNKNTTTRKLLFIIIKKKKQNYFNSLNEKNIFESRKFWKTLKPVFFNKSIANGNIILVENERVLYNDDKIAEILNNFFPNVTKALGILQNVYSDLFIGDIDDPTLRAIVNY